MNEKMKKSIVMIIIYCLCFGFLTLFIGSLYPIKNNTGLKETAADKRLHLLQITIHRKRIKQKLTTLLSILPALLIHMMKPLHPFQQRNQSLHRYRLQLLFLYMNLKKAVILRLRSFFMTIMWLGIYAIENCWSP